MLDLPYIYVRTFVIFADIEETNHEYRSHSLLDLDRRFLYFLSNKGNIL